MLTLASKDVDASVAWSETQGDVATLSVGPRTAVFSLQSATLALSIVCLTVTSQRAYVKNKCLCHSQIAQTAKFTDTKRKQD